MKVDIYATTRRNTFIVVRSGTPIPAGLPTTRQFKSLELVPGKPLIALDPDEVIADIEAQGWAAIGAAVEVEVVG